MHPADCPRCGTRGIVALGKRPPDARGVIDGPELLCPNPDCRHEWRKVGARYVIGRADELDAQAVYDALFGADGDCGGDRE